MEKLVILLMILLFAVGLTSKSIYEDNGVQSDATKMKDNTQLIIKNANTKMEQFGGTSTTTTPTTP